MKIETVIVGSLQSNCYVVYDEESLDAIVIDPGEQPGKIAEILAGRNLRVSHIVCTHGHFDHLGAVARLKEKTGAPIAMSGDDLELYLQAREQAVSWGFEIEAPPRPDLLVAEGTELAAGSLKFTVISTPGHSPGGICLYGQGVVFTGDTVFAGSVGRTDLYGGSMEALKKSFARVMSLPPETRLFPGHGPSSTIEQEKRFNFFMDEL